MRWDDYIFNHPNSTFFHRSGWSCLLESIFNHQTFYLIAERDERIVGVLPLAHVKSFLFGNALTSLPFAVYGGALGDDQSIILALQSEACSLAKSLGAEHLELRYIDANNPDWPTQDLYVTFRKELLPSADENLNAIPRKQRAMVRKGIKNGLVSHLDTDVSEFFNLYADNVHRHGTPALPKKYFEALKLTFAEDCEILLVRDSNGVVVSGVLSFYFKDEVLPYYAGDLVAARDLAANDFKYWELMRLACERGIKVFDYGRSKQGTGSYSFKKNWGFEPRALHYEYCLLKRNDIPQNNPMNAKYQLLISAWKKMPIGLANWLGPFVVRSLG